MRSQRFTHWAVVTVANALMICAAIADAQSLAGLPAKIEIVRQSAAPRAGEVAKLRLELLDPQNQPAKADKDVTIEITGHSRRREVAKLTAVIKAGDSREVVDVPLQESGLLRVSASNPQLIGGATILNVRPAENAAVSPKPAEVESPPPSPAGSVAEAPSPLTIAPGQSFTPAPHAFSASRLSLRATNGRAPTTRARSEMSLTTAAASSTASTPAPSPSLGATGPAVTVTAASGAPETSPPGSWTPSLTFDYTPSDHPLRAEIDAATIYAMLPPEKSAPWDMYVYLLSSNGDIGPIKIPKGSNIGETKLVANQPARVTLKFRSSAPWAAPVSGVPLQIAFGSPVAALSVRVNPPTIGLFETAEVILQLVNEKGIVVPTDEKRPVNVAVESGGGEVEESDLTIDSNGSRATTHFVPTLPGVAVLTAWSPNLPNVSTTVKIAPPYLQLILCTVGGLLGGLLAFWEEKPAYKHRIVIGLITGFVLYWAILFLVVKIPGLPHAAVLNPASVLVISLVGGWQGTKLLSFLAQRFGLA